MNYPYKYRDYSFGAAQALLSAGAQGKFWEMHDKLLETSPDLSQDSLVKIAEELGLDMDRFASELAAMKNKAEIDADVKIAHDLDLYNTPTFFINGRMVVGNRPYSYLKKIVEEELQSAGK